MIIIKHIEFIETDRDPFEIIRQNMPYVGIPVITDEGEDIVECSLISELIKGRRFRRPSDNKDIVIGVSKQAQDVIGIQYEAWATEFKLRCSLEDRLSDSNRMLNYINNSSVFERFKWLFTGVKYGH